MRQLAGRVELDARSADLRREGDAELPLQERVDRPQYAMSAPQSTRRVGKMVSELLKSRGFDYKSALPELERRVKLVGSTRTS